MVGDEKNPDARHAPRQGALELEPEAPALRCRRLEQRVRIRCAKNFLAGGTDERGRPPCRTVSAAGTTTNPTVRARDGCTRSGIEPELPTSTRSSRSTSCTSTCP